MIFCELILFLKEANYEHNDDIKKIQNILCQHVMPYLSSMLKHVSLEYLSKTLCSKLGYSDYQKLHGLFTRLDEYKDTNLLDDCKNHSLNERVS